MPTDPVCGMYVPEGSSIFTVVDGEKVYFCSKSCMLEYTSPDEREKSLRYRLAVAWIFSIPILIITYLLQFAYRDYILLLLALPVHYTFYPRSWGFLDSDRFVQDQISVQNHACWSTHLRMKGKRVFDTGLL